MFIFIFKVVFRMLRLNEATPRNTLQNNEKTTTFQMKV